MATWQKIAERAEAHNEELILKTARLKKESVRAFQATLNPDDEEDYFLSERIDEYLLEVHKEEEKT